jgi:hypothetical protein
MQESPEHIKVKKFRQYMNNVTLGRVGATSIAVEKHAIIQILSLCL